jgi:hypothetical protein
LSQPNLALVEINGADPVNVTSIVGETDVIVIDWGYIDPSGSCSTEDALIEIAKLKIKLYPWQEQITQVWSDLLQRETDWLDGAASDANLTYSFGRNE